MTAPDLRTAAMAVSTTWDQTWGKVGVAELENTMAPLIDALRDAALAAEATEPPPCCAHPKDEHSYEGNPEADPRYEPMWCDHKDCPCPGWGMTGSAPNPQGADEPLRLLENLPAVVREKRQREGLRHEALGELIGVAYGDLCRFELGKKDPRLSTVIKLVRWASAGVPDEPGDDDLMEDIAAECEGQMKRAERAEGERDALLAEVERLRAAAPASEDTSGVIFDGPPPRAIDVGPADLVPPAAGSPPPTPAPTREQIHDAIADALSEHVWARGSGEIDGDGITEAADAVMALWSAKPAPPLWTGPAGALGRELHNQGTSKVLGLPPGTAVEVREKQP